MRFPPVVLVTGTDTGVGKTVVTAAIASILSDRGAVAVYKPAQTGVTPDEPGDVDEVQRLSGVRATFEGVRLRDPLAPATAARREGVDLPAVKEHAQRVHDLLTEFDYVVVEGAGGLLVGLDDDGRGLCDLAFALNVPSGFVLVNRAGLGTLNHTALTVEALQVRRLDLLGLVIGSYPESPDLAEQTNVDDLAGVTGVEVIGRLPEAASALSPDVFRASAATWLALGGDGA